MVLIGRASGLAVRPTIIAEYFLVVYIILNVTYVRVFTRMKQCVEEAQVKLRLTVPDGLLVGLSKSRNVGSSDV